mgnify:CR=1 FL=1
MYNKSCHGGVAQLVEHAVHTRSVAGSNPAAATIFFRKTLVLYQVFFFFSEVVSTAFIP